MYFQDLLIRCTFSIYLLDVLTRCTHSMYLLDVLTWCVYSMYLLDLITQCTYPMCLHNILTQFTYSIYSLDVLTWCTYSMYLLDVFTQCTYLMYLLDVLKGCTYLMYLLDVLTRCTYSMYLLNVQGDKVTWWQDYTVTSWQGDRMTRWKCDKVISNKWQGDKVTTLLARYCHFETFWSLNWEEELYAVWQVLEELSLLKTMSQGMLCKPSSVTNDNIWWLTFQSFLSHIIMSLMLMRILDVCVRSHTSPVTFCAVFKNKGFCPQNFIDNMEGRIHLFAIIFNFLYILIMLCEITFLCGGEHSMLIYWSFKSAWTLQLD
jgi:hypothetical protein